MTDPIHDACWRVIEDAIRERDQARAALAACVRYQYGVNDMNGWEEAAAAWTEARRIVALTT